MAEKLRSPEKSERSGRELESFEASEIVDWRKHRADGAPGHGLRPDASRFSSCSCQRYCQRHSDVVRPLRLRRQWSGQQGPHALVLDAPSCGMGLMVLRPDGL